MKNKKGFTLVELVVTLTVSAIICGLIISLIMSYMRQSNKVRVNSEVIGEVADVYKKIDYWFSKYDSSKYTYQQLNPQSGSITQNSKYVAIVDNSTGNKNGATIYYNFIDGVGTLTTRMSNNEAYSYNYKLITKIDFEIKQPTGEGVASTGKTRNVLFKATVYYNDPRTGQEAEMPLVFVSHSNVSRDRVNQLG